MINVKMLQPEGRVPYRKHETDSGADLYYAGPESRCIQAGSTAVVGTGIAIEPPQGMELQVRPRSSLSSKGILVHWGTVDNGYRGEVKVSITNTTDSDFYIHEGDRIAQLVIAPVVYPKFRVVEELGETERGVGGFGSTGQ